MYTSMKNPEADCTFLWEQSVGLIRRSPDQGYGLGSFSQLVSTPHLSEKGSISPDSPEIWALIPDHGFLQCPSLRTNRS